MNIMLNSLDRPFGLSNSKYERETREILHFVKHDRLTIFHNKIIAVFVWS
jgi:hypothetical protein